MEMQPAWSFEPTPPGAYLYDDVVKLHGQERGDPQRQAATRACDACDSENIGTPDSTPVCAPVAGASPAASGRDLALPKPFGERLAGDIPPAGQHWGRLCLARKTRN
jgi:hypothetical protein